MFTADFRDFQRLADRLGGMARELPFATATAMNRAADTTRKALIEETWPAHTTVRNRSFVKAALTTKGARATKNNLVVEIYDKLGRAALEQHAHGGVKRAKRRLAIPPSSGKGAVTRTSRGVKASQRPAAIIAATPKRALRVTPGGIFTGEGGRLQLRYAFKASANIKPTVPFEKDFGASMRREIQREFPAAWARANKPRPTR